MIKANLIFISGCVPSSASWKSISKLSSIVCSTTKGQSSTATATTTTSSPTTTATTSLLHSTVGGWYQCFIVKSNWCFLTGTQHPILANFFYWTRSCENWPQLNIVKVCLCVEISVTPHYVRKRIECMIFFSVLVHRVVPST